MDGRIWRSLGRIEKTMDAARMRTNTVHVINTKYFWMLYRGGLRNRLSESAGSGRGFSTRQGPNAAYALLFH